MTDAPSAFVRASPSSTLPRPTGLASRRKRGRGYERASSCAGYFLFTPGILPSALRASCAVRSRSCGFVGQQEKVTRAPAGVRHARRISGKPPKTPPWLRSLRANQDANQAVGKSRIH